MTEVTPRFKELPVRKKAYKDSFRDQPCISCGRRGTTVGAHIRTGMEGGTGYKPSDDLIVGLCFHCHGDQEANPGPEWWVQHVLKPIARRMYRQWANG